MVNKKRAGELAAELDRYIYQLKTKRPFEPKRLTSILEEIFVILKEFSKE